jgi:hypothetical protein
VVPVRGGDLDLGDGNVQLVKAKTKVAKAKTKGAKAKTTVAKKESDVVHKKGTALAIQNGEFDPSTPDDTPGYQDLWVAVVEKEVRKGNYVSVKFLKPKISDHPEGGYVYFKEKKATRVHLSSVFFHYTKLSGDGSIVTGAIGDLEWHQSVSALMEEREKDRVEGMASMDDAG